MADIDCRSFQARCRPIRHHVVHDVVAGGDLVEHVVDAALLVVEPHVLEAEMGRLVAEFGAGHACCLRPPL